MGLRAYRMNKRNDDDYAHHNQVTCFATLFICLGVQTESWWMHRSMSTATHRTSQWFVPIYVWANNGMWPSKRTLSTTRGLWSQKNNEKVHLSLAMTTRSIDIVQNKYTYNNQQKFLFFSYFYCFLAILPTLFFYWMLMAGDIIIIWFPLKPRWSHKRLLG
jgi:hypothetical protein